MTGLREYFEDATEAPPPSRLLADEVYTAGRRRLRRRRTAGGAVAALAACAMAGVALVALPGAGPGPSPDDRAANAGSKGTPGALPRSGGIQWAGAADAQHLYLALATCAGTPTCKTQGQLVGSDDGGQSWTERGTPMSFGGVSVLGPDLLITTVADQAAGVDRTKLVSSRDGGRSWQDAGSGVAVPAAPAGDTVVCRPTPNLDDAGLPIAEPCELYAFDPASNQLSRLAEQPPLLLIDRQAITASDGRLWAPGYDRATGRAAITTSTDRGRTWSSHVFADAPACTVESCNLPWLAAGSGQVAYAVLNSDKRPRVYRYTSGGGWRHSAGAAQVLQRPTHTGSFVTPDGAHVLYQYLDPRSSGAVGTGEYQFWIARSGADSYQPIRMLGMSAKSGEIGRTATGWFYSRGDGDVSYGSTDGLNWVPLNRR